MTCVPKARHRKSEPFPPSARTTARVAPLRAPPRACAADGKGGLEVAEAGTVVLHQI